MKIFRLPQLTESAGGGEFRLGPDELSTDSIYLVYGRLCPGESGRVIEAGGSGEEVVCVTKGKILVKGDSFDFKVAEGEAFRLNGNGPLRVVNTADDEEAVYIICGGEAAGAAPPEAESDPQETARPETSGAETSDQETSGPETSSKDEAKGEAAKEGAPYTPDTPDTDDKQGAD